PDYIYGDEGRQVFVHTNYLGYGAFRNASVVPELEIVETKQLLDPRLKGRISMRDAGAPNFGAFTLAAIYKQEGADFLRKLLSEQEPRVYENPQQLDLALIRGGQAVAIGGQSDAYKRCQDD